CSRRYWKRIYGGIGRGKQAVTKRRETAVDLTPTTEETPRPGSATNVRGGASRCLPRS
ncbi:MAG: hypothetical protein AVDCRST_MAG12-1050, partial [uncultured Rubrobacteraceae bacterium]